MKHYRLFLLFATSIVFFNYCTSQSNMESEYKFTNDLVHETSPYLLQHAHNPVNWMPWGDKALKKAKADNKLMLISVGYAACHWCHVMEHESFEDSTVAALMNQHFVCIKVDREERPDVDQIYMDAVQLMTGSGGWPLNCVTLPDGRPIWGGTYFPKENWMNILDQLSQLWLNAPDEAYGYAERLTKAVKQMDAIVPVDNPQPFAWSDIDSVLDPWKGTFDLKEGGRNQAPKFPIPNNWKFLMRAEHFRSDPQIREAVDLTLKKIAWGGIYDHLGGGFARYSVDQYWKVPHFEKMTYDNGQLVSLYAEAYQRQPDPLFKRIVYETLEYTAREMTSPEGGFYSSLDADSEGEEGKFYVWQKSEIDAVLGADAEWFCAYYQVTKSGNWEHGNNVLIMAQSLEDFATQKAKKAEKLERDLEKAKRKLFEKRSQRIRPGLDDKVLTAWNALMLKGYVDAYRVFGEKDFLAAALRNAEFIEQKLADGDRLHRNYKEGRATINAFLDDYALLAEAYIALYEATLDPRWIQRSRAYADYAIAHFYDEAQQLFFYTSDEDPALIARKKELMDNVIPGSNSTMANVLFELGHFFGNQHYGEISQQMLQNIKGDMPRYGSGYSNWGILMLKHLAPFHEVVIAGTKAQQLARELDGNYLPNMLLVGAEKETPDQLPLLEYRFVDGATRIYVCQNSVCKLPVDAASEAIKQMGY
ncbi:MAG: thioredoxin domain-containing protein [Bacteroidota bacterium]